MEITERELRRLVADVDDQHRGAMATFGPDNEELIFGDLRRATGPSRRRFLTGAGLGGVLLTIGTAAVPMRRLISPASAQAPSDTEIARFAASFEFAAVRAYEAAAASGKVTDKAVADAATKFAGHHREHGQAFQALAGGDVPANQAVVDMVSGQLQGAKDQAAVVDIAFGLENAAASTYLFGLGVLQTEKAYETAASILPVESQHAVVLGFVLGKPVSDKDMMPAFEPTDKALEPAKFPIT